MSEPKAPKKPKVITEESLIKKFGAGVFQSGDQIISQKKLIIPFSPALDVILGGGVPQGSVVRLAGEEKCGKTLSALQLAANAQAADPATFVLFLNVETRIKSRDLKGIADLDTSKERFLAISSYRNWDEDEEDGDETSGEGKILSAEDFLEIAEFYIKNRPKCVIIVDSVSQLVTNLELSGDLGDRHRAPGAVLMSQFIKRNSGAVAVNKSILVAIVHMITDTGPSRRTKSESGGTKIRFATDVGMQAEYVEKWKIGVVKDVQDSGTQIGQKVKWRTNSTSIVGPGQVAWSYIKYGLGIDKAKELFELGIAATVVLQNGAWYTHTYMENHLDVLGVEKWEKEGEKLCKAQGAEKALQLLRDNPDWLPYLQHDVYEMLGIQTLTEI